MDGRGLRFLTAFGMTGTFEVPCSSVSEMHIGPITVIMSLRFPRFSGNDENVDSPTLAMHRLRNLLSPIVDAIARVSW